VKKFHLTDMERQLKKLSKLMKKGIFAPYLLKFTDYDDSLIKWQRAYRFNKYDSSCVIKKQNILPIEIKQDTSPIEGAYLFNKAKVFKKTTRAVKYFEQELGVIKGTPLHKNF